MYKSSLNPFLLLAVILLLAACEDEVSEARDVASLVSSAQLYVDQGQYRAALIEIQNIRQIEPTNESALILAAKVSIELGSFKQAYRRLELSGGSSIEYFETLVEAYIGSRKYSSALAVLLQQKTLFSSHEISRRLFTGRAYAGLGQFDVAKAEFEKVLVVEPGNLGAKIGNIAILVLRGDLIAAEDKLTDILAGDPGHIPAREWMTIVYLRQDLLDKAEDSLTETIAILPVTDLYTRQRAGVLRTLIVLLARQGRSGEALVYQRILAEAFPEAEENKSLFTDALAQIGNGELDEAEDILLELYRQAPGSETGGKLLGLLNFVQGREEQAYHYFSQSVDVETATPRILEAVATNLLDMNQPKKVVEALKDKVPATRNPELLALYGVAAIKASLVNDGVKALLRAIDLNPGNVRLRLLLTAHYNSLSPPDRTSAYQLLKAGYAINPESAEMAIALLDQLLRMDRRSEAEKIVEVRQSEQPENYNTNVVAGAFWSRMGEVDKALGFYQKAVLIDASQITALSGIANANVHAERWQEARDAYQKVIALDRSNSVALVGLLQTYVNTGDVQKGIAELEGLTEVDPDVISAVITEYYTRTNSLEKAETQLRTLVRRSPGSQLTKRLSAEVNFKRAIRAAAEKDYVTARTSIFNALASFPLNRKLLRALALVEIRSGQLREARKVIEDIQKQYPDSALIYDLTGDLALAEKNLTLAEDNYLKAFDKSPEDRLGLKVVAVMKSQAKSDDAEEFTIAWKARMPSSVLSVVSRVEIHPDDMSRAVSIYEKQNTDFPDTPGIMNNLAWYYFQNNELEKGLPVAEKAYQIASTNPSVMDTYAWLLYQRGEVRKSLVILREAGKLAPGDSAIQEHLAEVIANIE